MSIRKRNGAWFIDFRPFNEKKVGVKIDVRSKTEARLVETAILIACRTGDYAGLDAITRDATIRMFRNQKLELPPGLRPEQPTAELTLMKAAKMTLNSPGIIDSDNRARHEMSFAHILEHFGEGRSVKAIWVPELREYQQARVKQGAAGATVNREMCSLSRMFNLLMESRLLDVNPCRMLKGLSTKSGERQVYLGFADVSKIIGACPEWYRPIAWTAYYTGMRRGEILGLSRRRVDLDARMIRMTPEHTKESRFKRVPIHRDLVPILHSAIRVPYLGSDSVFLLHDARGYRPLGTESFKNVWERVMIKLEWPKPWPRFHDLRHTWKTNARRSGIDSQISEAILGHSDRALSVKDRYGHISDTELVAAIDQFGTDHGSTIILTSACK